MKIRTHLTTIGVMAATWTLIASMTAGTPIALSTIVPLFLLSTVGASAIWLGVMRPIGKCLNLIKEPLSPIADALGLSKMFTQIRNHQLNTQQHGIMISMIAAFWCLIAYLINPHSLTLSNALLGTITIIIEASVVWLTVYKVTEISQKGYHMAKKSIEKVKDQAIDTHNTTKEFVASTLWEPTREFCIQWTHNHHPQTNIDQPSVINQPKNVTEACKPPSP